MESPQEWGIHLGMGKPVGVVIPLEWAPPEWGIGEILEWGALRDGDLAWEWGAHRNGELSGMGSPAE